MKEYDELSANRPNSVRSRGSDQQSVPKRKSAAHHMMFDSSQAPWGTNQAAGSVPQIKKVDIAELPAAGKKTFSRQTIESDSMISSQ